MHPRILPHVGQQGRFAGQGHIAYDPLPQTQIADGGNVLGRHSLTEGEGQSSVDGVKQADATAVGTDHMDHPFNRVGEERLQI